MKSNFCSFGTVDLLDKAKCLYTIYHEISLISEISGIDSSYEIPDELWNQIFPLLVHKPKRKKKTGRRPRIDDRKAMNAIFYIARTGCQWKHYHEVLVHPVLYMTDIRNRDKMEYSNVCRLMV